MNRNILIGIIIVIIAAGAYMLLRNRTETTQNETSSAVTTTPPPSDGSVGISGATASETRVVYSDSGYSPSVLEIAAGTTVTFVNESSKTMWPASDPHPIHIKYRQFDSKRGYATGESYSFTFDRAGTWEYHNHLVPQDGGTIIVK